MKQIILLLAILAALDVHAQDPCTINGVRARIGNFNSGIRINTYKNKKFAALSGTGERTQISFTKSAVVALLKTINVTTAGIKKYDGLRVYFAVNPINGDPEKDKMTFVFVPTTAQDGDVHRDDIDNCWAIKTGAAAPLKLTADEASTWIRTFQDGVNSKYDKLTKDGKARQNDDEYQETKSLWYDIDALTDEEGGLLFFLNCSNSKITDVILKFGGYGISLPNRKYAYHLTLIWGLKKMDGKSFNLSFTRKRKFGVAFGWEPKDLFDDEDRFDTGIPCPPPPKDKDSCDGAMLPQ